MVVTERSGAKLNWAGGVISIKDLRPEHAQCFREKSKAGVE